MKRSEALEIIAEKLLTTRGLFGGAADEWEEVREETKMYRIKIANAALKAMEEIKMLPPCRNADQKSDYGYARVYTWNKEDWEE